MFSNIFVRLKLWWRNADKILLFLSFGIAFAIHIYVKNVDKKQNKRAHVYLEEQGGSDASKETNCRRAQKADHRSD